MDFLLEPMELGTEFEDLVKTAVQIICESGYSCDTGTIQDDPKKP